MSASHDAECVCQGPVWSASQMQVKSCLASPSSRIVLTHYNGRSAVHCACVTRTKSWVSLFCLQSPLLPTAHLQLPCIAVCAALEQGTRPDTHGLISNIVHSSYYPLLLLSTWKEQAATCYAAKPASLLYWVYHPCRIL